LCTLALARYLGGLVTPVLAHEVQRVLRERCMSPLPFSFVHSALSSRLPARQISYADSLTFEKVHEAAYREHGFELVDVAASSLTDRVAIVEARLAAERN